MADRTVSISLLLNNLMERLAYDGNGLFNQPVVNDFRRSSVINGGGVAPPASQVLDHVTHKFQWLYHVLRSRFSMVAISVLYDVIINQK